MVEKSISTPLLDVSVERVNGEDVGATTGILFEGYIETHNPNTKLLELFNKAEVIEVVY